MTSVVYCVGMARVTDSVVVGDPVTLPWRLRADICVILEAMCGHNHTSNIHAHTYKSFIPIIPLRRSSGLFYGPYRGLELGPVATWDPTLVLGGSLSRLMLF